MLNSRLLAGMCSLSFIFALGVTLRLAVAHALEAEPSLAPDALRTAVRLNPRDSTAWMELGLAAEQNGDMDQAAKYFLAAENVDRQYLPAWTSANFFFRRSNDPQFWRAAKRAAAMSYDDPAPLIELADHRELEPLAALERLGDSARLEQGYLRFLISQARWRKAGTVAARLSSRRDVRDQELLLDFTDRLIGANEGEAALAAWNELQQSPAPNRASRGTLVNTTFQRQPSGHGFDWRMTAPPRGSVHWEASKLDYWLAESTPDDCTLLEQWVVLNPGRYRLRFEHRTEGLAQETGLRWTLLHGGRLEASSSVPEKISDWSFKVTKADLYRLAWTYHRVPGTTHRQGLAELTSVALEMR